METLVWGLSKKKCFNNTMALTAVNLAFVVYKSDLIYYILFH